MLFRFIWVGKTRNAELRALSEEYFKRVSRFVRAEIVEVRECAGGSNVEGIEEEGRRIISALRTDTLVVLLDVQGSEKSSLDVANDIKHWQNSGAKQIAFVIGGHSGVSELVAARARATWSLSRLTFTHEMARVLLLEQIYRGFTILNGFPYQK